jgi:hypothetical protein
VNRRKQSIERRPVERPLDPIQKSTALPATDHHRINERRLGKVTARHRRIILFGLASENQKLPTSAKLSHTIAWQKPNIVVYYFVRSIRRQMARKEGRAVEAIYALGTSCAEAEGRENFYLDSP